MIQITPEILDLYLKKLDDLMVNGEVINHMHTTKCSTHIKDGDGNVLRTIEKVTENRKTTILPTPAYVHGLIERSSSVQAAMDFLLQKGYLVLDPTVPEQKDEAPKGLSDHAVNMIKSRLLGLEN